MNLMNYSKKLIDSVNKYNENLELIAQRILNLKIDFNEKDIEVRHLHGLREKMSVINNTKSRKEMEKLLEDVIIEYGYMLEVFRDSGEFPKEK